MYKQISANVRLTWFLMSIFVLFVIGIGYVFSILYDSTLIILIAIFIAVFQSITSYYYSDKIALLTTGAKQTKREDYLELYRIVENLCIAAGLPQPKIFIIQDLSPNAFATGRDPKNAVIVVTSGLLEKLDRTELEGVISHELSHIGNYDIRLMTVIVVLVGLIALLADWGLRIGFWSSRDNDNRDGGAWMLLIALVLWVIAPISATLIQLAVSRRREYLADATGALITRYPEGLASALDKISKNKSNLKRTNRATAHLFIADPFGADRKTNFAKEESWFSIVFSTHPPIRERIKRLKDMIK